MTWLLGVDVREGRTTHQGSVMLNLGHGHGIVGDDRVLDLKRGIEWSEQRAAKDIEDYGGTRVTKKSETSELWILVRKASHNRSKCIARLSHFFCHPRAIVGRGVVSCAYVITYLYPFVSFLHTTPRTTNYEWLHFYCKSPAYVLPSEQFLVFYLLS